VRGKLRNRADRKRTFVLDDFREFRCGLEDAVGDAFGIDARQCRALAARVRIPPGREAAPWSGGVDVLTLVGIVVLHARPAVVLETGVATGFTSAVILGALQDNGAGVLHSIDLPPLQVDAATFVGRAIPDHLRDRWTLHLGPSRTLLPRVARAIAPIGVFLHDGDHSYAGQRRDLQEAWPYLAPGAALVCDDVRNAAFVDFAESVGARPYLIAPPGQSAAVGLLTNGTR